ncbi:hypothetical protein HGRIS_001712 [Hohenbuehelia grisea]|uniref:F-box domain-containing protein n=1 Tax=Hohenbuehelia grisea TaxID=104357 RepID=A0ABR3JIB8_9AGAR
MVHEPTAVELPASMQPTSSPISNLPNEVLCHIFRLIHGDRHPVNPRDFSFSWVCHNWREVALNDPLIWNTIFIHTGVQPSMLQFADIMLERAKFCNLEITYDGYGHQSQASVALGRQIMKTALAFPNEVHTLDLNNDSLEILEEMVTPLSAGMKNLRALSISFTRNHNDTTFFELPAILKTQRAPSLRSFSLRKCSLPWESTFYRSFASSLTTLCVSCMLPTVSRRYLVQQLRNLHCIENLTLHLCMETRPENETEAEEPVNLSRLQALSFSYDHDASLPFLGFITYRPTASIQYTSHHTTYQSLIGTLNDGDYAASRTSFGLIKCLIPDPAIDSLAFRIDLTSYQAHFQLQVCQSRQILPEPYRVLCLSGLEGLDPILGDTIFTKMLSRMNAPRDQIAFVRLTCKYRTTWSDGNSLLWWEYLATLGSVVEIETNDPFFARSLSTIKGCIDSFPRLTKLILRYGNIDDLPSSNIAFPFEELHGWLLSRAASKPQLKELELRIVENNLSTDQVELLRKVVSHVNVIEQRYYY